MVWRFFGEVGQGVKGIRQSIIKRGLSGPKAKTLNAVANYLYRNRSRMRYDEYLANGWLIASGPVEVDQCLDYFEHLRLDGLKDLIGHARSGSGGSVAARASKPME